MTKFFLLIAIIPISGCATSSKTAAESEDIYESFNRISYSFNSTIDNVILRPIARGYDVAAPPFVKIGVSNFFSNLGEIETIINMSFQGKFAGAFSDTGRFIVNSTVGLGGFIDVATDLGLEQHDEDFGQTLGTWGINSGPYVVLPLLGPSTVRDVFAAPFDSFTSLTRDINHIPTRNSVYFMDVVDLRYRLLAIDSQLEDAMDEYSFVRDAFLMRRQYQVYDGDPPEEEDFYEDDFCEKISNSENTNNSQSISDEGCTQLENIHGSVVGISTLK